MITNATPEKMTPMHQEQKDRAARLYQMAKLALDAAAEERLNLDALTRQALDEARGKLEKFDWLRSMQPLIPE